MIQALEYSNNGKNIDALRICWDLLERPEVDSYRRACVGILAAKIVSFKEYPNPEELVHISLADLEAARKDYEDPLDEAGEQVIQECRDFAQNLLGEIEVEKREWQEYNRILAAAGEDKEGSLKEFVLGGIDLELQDTTSRQGLLSAIICLIRNVASRWLQGDGSPGKAPQQQSPMRAGSGSALKASQQQGLMRTGSILEACHASLSGPFNDGVWRRSSSFDTHYTASTAPRTPVPRRSTNIAVNSSTSTHRTSDSLFVKLIRRRDIRRDSIFVKPIRRRIKFDSDRNKIDPGRLSYRSEPAAPATRNRAIVDEHSSEDDEIMIPVDESDDDLDVGGNDKDDGGSTNTLPSA